MRKGRYLRFQFSERCGCVSASRGTFGCLALRLARSLLIATLRNQATMPPPGRGWDHIQNPRFFTSEDTNATARVTVSAPRAASKQDAVSQRTVSVSARLCEETRQRPDETYWGAAVGQGRHADRHAHLVAGRGGEGGRGGAPFLHFLPLEEVAPCPLDAAFGRRRKKTGLGEI